MPKPTLMPRWATAGGADVTDPSSGQKDSGYVDAQSPDAGELNWLLNKIYLWTDWLRTYEDTAHSWTKSQSFADSTLTGAAIFAQGGGSFPGLRADGDGGIGSAIEAYNSGSGAALVASNFSTGAAIVATTTAGTSAALRAIGAATSTATVDVTGGVIQVRGVGTGNVFKGTSSSASLAAVYGIGTGLGSGVRGESAGGGQAGVHGLGDAAPGVRGTSLTGPGVHGQSSTAAGSIGMSGTILDSSPTTAFAFRFFKETAGSPTIPDAGYSNVLGQICGALQFTGANPAKTAAIPVNSTTGIGIIKASGTVVLNGTVTPNYVDGHNVTTISQAGGTVTVTFATPMADVAYRVIMTPQGGAFYEYVPLINKSTGSFTFGMTNVNTGVTLSTLAAGTNAAWDFIILGRQ